MSALDKISHVGQYISEDFSHAFNEVGALVKNASMKLSTEASTMANNTAEKHLPPCTIEDLTGTVPRDCEYTPKKTAPGDIPTAPKSPNKFGPDDPKFD